MNADIILCTIVFNVLTNVSSNFLWSTCIGGVVVTLMVTQTFQWSPGLVKEVAKTIVH